MSTALERSFIERGDFAVFHEPYAYVYFMLEDRAAIPHKHPDPDHPRTYGEIRDLLDRARLNRPVFLKDFPYHALDHLLADPQYLLRQTNTFLIRDPEQAVLSHANVHPGVTREVLGYEQLVTLFDSVRDLTGTTPIVINAADLATDPVGTLQSYCSAIGIDFRPEALSWDAGDRPEWDTWKGWHGDVAASSGLTAPSQSYRLGHDDLPHLRGFVDFCTPYYEYLDQFRVRPVTGALT